MTDEMNKAVLGLFMDNVHGNETINTLVAQIVALTDERDTVVAQRDARANITPLELAALQAELILVRQQLSEREEVAKTNHARFLALEAERN
ncbi:MAG: hypothetical protein C0514_02465 [Candidatus Puniceispirillum sp.]|nr:hypothetical protein [Candidatus Puniceispirillum sp.]